MKTKLSIAILLASISSISHAAYVMHIPTEAKLGGHLENGSIIFKGNAGGGTGGVQPVDPVEPETPEEPENKPEKRELLYSTAFNHYGTTDTYFLFSNTTFAGTPFSCGEITSTCVQSNYVAGTVTFKYIGHNADYGSSFYIPDSIVVKTAYYKSSTECKFGGTTSAPWAVTTGGGVYFTITYNCGAGNLPAPLAPPYTAAHNPTTSLGFSADFYKITKE